VGRPRRIEAGNDSGAQSMTWLLDLIAPWWAKLAIVAVIIGGLYAWHWDDKRAAVAEAVAEANAKCEAASIALQRDALALELSNMKANAEKQERAKNDAEKRAKNNAVAAAGARSELDRLRVAVAFPASSVIETPERAIRVGATARGLLSDCAARYIDVAEKADRHALDVRLLLDSWPK